MKALAHLIAIRTKLINNIGEEKYQQRIGPYKTTLKQVKDMNQNTYPEALKQIKDSKLCAIFESDKPEIKVEKGIKLEFFTCAMLDLMEAES
jgi:hypothetical protein